MERNFVYSSPSLDGYTNLAIDEWFLDHVGEEDLILYFYQNENAVIIGKNQNPWLECDLDQMRRDQVQLVRRVSGGGAVYHDLGNLNFSFIAGAKRYDLSRQLSLILKAIESLGIPCSFSGRNDLVVEDYKFSGNAFADRKGKKQHHGTLLVSSDLDRLSRYLTVDPEKIRSKGISSVRSRVCNLNRFSPDLTVRAVKGAILKAWEAEYGYYGEWSFCEKEQKELEEYRAKHESVEWKLGQTPKFDLEWKKRLPWGGVQLLLSFEKGKISKAQVFSDAMDASLCPEISRLLTGIAFSDESIQRALISSSIPQVKDLARFSFLRS